MTSYRSNPGHAYFFNMQLFRYVQWSYGNPYEVTIHLKYNVPVTNDPKSSSVTALAWSGSQLLRFPIGMMWKYTLYGRPNHCREPCTCAFTHSWSRGNYFCIANLTPAMFLEAGGNNRTWRKPGHMEMWRIVNFHTDRNPSSDHCTTVLIQNAIEKS